MKTFIIGSTSEGFKGCLMMPSGLKRWTPRVLTYAEAEELLAQKVQRFG